MLAVVLTGCGAGEQEEAGEDTGTTAAGTTAESGSDGSADTSDGLGSPDDPLPACATVRLDGWEFTFGETIFDASRERPAEYHITPAEGSQYVVVSVAAKNTSQFPGSPLVAMNFAYQTTDGELFDGNNGICSVTHEPLQRYDLEVAPGESATGNVCRQVPGDKAEGGTWVVSTSVDEKAYVSAR